MSQEFKKSAGDLLNKMKQASGKNSRKRALKPEFESSGKLSGLEQLLPSVLSRMGLEKRLNEHTLLQLSLQFIPASMQNRVRPLFIDSQKNLVIAVSDAAAAQELSMLKSKLLQGLAACARQLSIELCGLRVDMKSYHRILQQEKDAAVENEVLPSPAEEDLARQELSQNDRELIKEFSKLIEEKNQELDPRLRKGIVRTYEKQLQLLSWRRQNGYPVCEACDNPVSRLYLHGEDKLCLNCKLASA